MMEAIQLENVDVVIGSRFLQKGNMKIGFSKKVAINFFQHIIHLTTNKCITDPTSGFKAYKAKVYENSPNLVSFFMICRIVTLSLDILLRDLNILKYRSTCLIDNTGKVKSIQQD